MPNTDECTLQEQKLIEGLGLGMTQAQASQFAGYAYTSGAAKALNRPRVQAQLAILREEARAKYSVTRDDVIRGLQDAIGDAKMAGEAMSQIAGWREIGRILGHYAPEEKRITLTGPQQAQKNQLESMTEEELLQLSGDSAIDGEFEVVDD